jgi:hypothetical protein
VSFPPSPYPHLASELQTLSGDALHLWGDAAERHRALGAILIAWDAGSPELPAAVERVDSAVEAGLRVLGLPRGPIRGVRLEPGLRWAGKKDQDCTLNLSVSAIREYLARKRLPDAVFRTWVHESLHARRVFAPDYRLEYARFSGYEEGLVESLARSILGQQANVTSIGGTFEYPVVAYRALAVTLGIDVDELCRRLWQVRPGEVRAALWGVVSDLCRERNGSELTADQRVKLRGLADAVFQSDRSGTSPDMAQLTRTWRLVLQ